MSLDYMLAIAVIGFIAAFITSVSGGGGLIAIPALLAIGIAPVNVLALNKLTDIGVIFGAGRNYFKAKKVDWKLVIGAVPVIMIGNYIASSAVVKMGESTLTWALLFAIVLAMIIILYPFDKVENKAQKAPTKLMVIFGFLLLLCQGLWGGAFGIAGATLGTLVYIHFFHKNFLEARSVEVFAAVPGVIITSIVLVSASSLVWHHMLIVVISSILGSYIGSKVAIKTNGKIIKHFMIFVALLMIAKVAFDLLLGARLDG